MIGAREANQRFSALLAAAERDRETVIITRRGRPIARLVPEPLAETVDHATEVRALIDRFARPMEGSSVSREDLYDRGASD